MPPVATDTGVLSTNTGPTATGTVLRRQKDGSRIPVPCPEAIISYNEFKGGVDRGDQLRGYYSCRTKSRKFYKYIFYFLLDVAITNAFVLYKHYAACPKYKTIRDFRVQLAKELIGDYCSRPEDSTASPFSSDPYCVLIKEYVHLLYTDHIIVQDNN